MDTTSLFQTATAAPERSRFSAALIGVLLTILCSALLVWPAALNRSPVIFSDTSSYFRAGEHTLQGMASPLHPKLTVATQEYWTSGARAHVQFHYFAAERSPYYGTFVVALFNLGGTWLVTLAQALIASGTVWIAIRRLGAAGPRSIAGLVGVLILVSGLAMFVSTMVPDFLAGILVLAIAMIAAFRSRLSPCETAWLYAAVFLAMVCHVTHLALAVVIIVGMAGLGWVAGRRPPLALAGLAATVLAAFLANIGFNLAVEKVLHAPVLSKPFLLARLLDDGTAVGYLNRHCAERRYALCRHLDKFPESGNDFLWSTDPRKGVLQFANLQELLQIQKEADGIIIGSVMERPLTQLRISLINACRQFVTVGASDYDNMSLTQLNGASPSSAFFPIVQGYAKARAARQGIPYAVISALMAGAYFASLAVLAVYGARQLRQGLGRLRQRLSAAWDDPFGWAALAVIVAVIANAANCGALSGVFDRYQGRVAWDVVFIAWLSLARWRRTPEQAFAA